MTKQTVSMKPKKDDLIAPIIREMLETDSCVINVVMADEATKRLGVPGDSKAISRVRNKIGLGSFDIAEAQAMKEIERVFPGINFKSKP